MQNWEYTSLTATGVVAIETFDDQLNELGALGWELVSVIGDAGNRAAYLKRPLPAAP